MEIQFYKFVFLLKFTEFYSLQKFKSAYSFNIEMIRTAELFLLNKNKQYILICFVMYYDINRLDFTGDLDGFCKPMLHFCMQIPKLPLNINRYTIQYTNLNALHFAGRHLFKSNLHYIKCTI